MVKSYISQWFYTFPWSQVVSGFWQKFPNPYTGHTLSEDTYYRTITDDQVIITKRLFAKTNKLPRWAERLFFRNTIPSIGFMIEESVCDLKQKIFTTNQININLKTFMTVKETCVYTPDKNDETRTVCDKKVTIQGELYGFKTTFETFAIQRYKKNQECQSLGLEYILHKLYLPQLPPPPITGIATPDTRTFSRKLSDKAKNFLNTSSNDAL